MLENLDVIDSRALRPTDCYGQRFMRPGTYCYHLLPSGGQHIDRERPYVVRVSDHKEKTAVMQQLTLSVAWKGQALRPDKVDVSVSTGDLVMWNCPDPSAPPFEVAGDKDFFNSARLVNECGFSHAFGLPGTYAWADAFGSGVGGTVRVLAPRCRNPAELAQWHSDLAKAAVVMIHHGKVEPAHVDIMTGQTVYFAIVASKGISITDRRLHAIGNCGYTTTTAR